MADSDAYEVAGWPIGIIALRLNGTRNKLSGAWVCRGTRVPVSALFENLKDGATVAQFLDWFTGSTAGTWKLSSPTKWNPWRMRWILKGLVRPRHPCSPAASFGRALGGHDLRDGLVQPSKRGPARPSRRGQLRPVHHHGPTVASSTEFYNSTTGGICPAIYFTAAHPTQGLRDPGCHQPDAAGRVPRDVYLIRIPTHEHTNR